MKCLRRYKWVKLPRNCLPTGKGVMGHWARLAARAAFRKGNGIYCGHINPVEPGMWAGGMVGLKSILDVKRRSVALETLVQLQELGYVSYTLDAKTKKLTYKLNDWVLKCSGAECLNGVVHTTDGYGFLCLPRNITERLVEQNYVFGEADAWLDLWCHTIFRDAGNAFSYFAPVIQYGKYGAAVTLESLGQRWGWEKTKVWRFFRKHRNVFPLYRLPGSSGCIVFNGSYPPGEEVSIPSQKQVEDIYRDIRMAAGKKKIDGTENQRLNRMIAWFSRKVIEYHRLLEAVSNTEDETACCMGCTVCRESLPSDGRVQSEKCRCSGLAGQEIRGPCRCMENKMKNFVGVPLEIGKVDCGSMRRHLSLGTLTST